MNEQKSKEELLEIEIRKKYESKINKPVGCGIKLLLGIVSFITGVVVMSISLILFEENEKVAQYSGAAAIFSTYFFLTNWYKKRLNRNRD